MIGIISKELLPSFVEGTTFDPVKQKREAEELFKFLTSNIHWRTLHYLFVELSAYNDMSNGDLLFTGDGK